MPKVIPFRNGETPSEVLERAAEHDFESMLVVGYVRGTGQLMLEGTEWSLRDLTLLHRHLGLIIDRQLMDPEG